MTERPRRLLLVDAIGGPRPEFYGPRLPKHLEVRALAVAVDGPEVTGKRAETLRRWFLTDVVANDDRLEEAIVEAAAEWRADGILGISEYVVHPAGAAARSLGLPANPERAQVALYDKHAQRTALRQGGVEVPAFRLVAEPADLEPALRQVGLPAVLKPLRGMASLAVFEIGSARDLETAYQEGVATYKSDLRVVGCEPLFLLERRLIGTRWHPDPRIGDYNSVETVVGAGRIVHLAIEDKLPLAPPFRESGHLIPSTLPDQRQRELLDLVERSVRALGITTAVLQTEIKVTAEGPRILEINGRCGGGSPTILAAGEASDEVAIMAGIALGEAPPEPTPFRLHVALLTPQAPARRVRITRVPDVDAIRRIPGVLTAEVSAKVGLEPDWRQGTKAMMRVLATSESREYLMGLAERLYGREFLDYDVLEGDESDDRVGQPVPG